jgi:hypothetical protein
MKTEPRNIVTSSLLFCNAVSFWSVWKDFSINADSVYYINLLRVCAGIQNVSKNFSKQLPFLFVRVVTSKPPCKFTEH